MPSSTEELRKKFGFGETIQGENGESYINDGIVAAEKVITDAGGYIFDDGIIRTFGIELTKELEDAIRFLCEEWDYGLIATN